MLNKLYSDLILRLKSNQYDFLRFDLVKLKKIKKLALMFASMYDNVVIIGFGASSLNIRALLSTFPAHAKKVIYLDSLDQIEIDENYHQLT